MTILESVKTCLGRKYFRFKGRASRSEYWWFRLFFMLGVIVFTAIALSEMGQYAAEGEVPLMVEIGFYGLVLWILFTFIPTLAVSVRRFHDVDKSGWLILMFLFLAIIPLVNIIVSFYWLVLNCTKGTSGANRFGEDPLARKAPPPIERSDDPPRPNPEKIRRSNHSTPTVRRT